MSLAGRPGCVVSSYPGGRQRVTGSPPGSSTVKGTRLVLIGEAARRAGVSRDTVRLYTRLGLVACTPRPAGSRAYANYDQDAVELIKNIKVAQSISCGQNSTTCQPVIDTANSNPDHAGQGWRAGPEIPERRLGRILPGVLLGPVAGGDCRDGGLGAGS
jgi:DNA-binding transcriptional MerR regulator